VFCLAGNGFASFLPSFLSSFFRNCFESFELVSFASFESFEFDVELLG